MVWVTTCILEPNLHNPGLKIPKWDPMSRRGFNMVLIKMHSTQVWLVLNFLTASISSQYHVICDGMFFTVVSITASDIEV